VRHLQLQRFDARDKSRTTTHLAVAGTVVSTLSRVLHEVCRPRRRLRSVETTVRTLVPLDEKTSSVASSADVRTRNLYATSYLNESERAILVVLGVTLPLVADTVHTVKVVDTPDTLPRPVRVVLTLSLRLAVVKRSVPRRSAVQGELVSTAGKLTSGAIPLDDEFHSLGSVEHLEAVCADADRHVPEIDEERDSLIFRHVYDQLWVQDFTHDILLSRDVYHTSVPHCGT
jgi:hypothetical protein